MTTVEFVTVTVSCIAIGASVVSVLLFVLYGMMQRRLILLEGDSRLPDDVRSLLQLLEPCFKDQVSDEQIKVLQAVVRRYSQTTLTSVLDDDTEEAYLFRALTNPDRLPWEAQEEPTPEQSQRASRPQ